LQRLWHAVRDRLRMATRYARTIIKNRIHRMGPRISARSHFPWPLGPVYERDALLLQAPGTGVGDNLLLTPILREIRGRNPSCQITVLTRHPELFESNPNVAYVVTDYKRYARRAIHVRYNHAFPMQVGRTAWMLSKVFQRNPLYRGYLFSTPSRTTLVSIMAESVGMQYESNVLDAPIALDDRIPTALDARLGARFICVQPRASAWTPNKTWPAEYWVNLITRLSEHHTVVEVGQKSVFSDITCEARPENYADLTGRTTLRDMLQIIGHSDLFIGPDSGGMHVARAYDVPSIIIYGGYSSPENFRYPNSVAFATDLPCAPCWLTTPCPFSLRCLTEIKVDMVYSAAMESMCKTEHH